MTEPFGTPPPISDSFQDRTQALAGRMRARRRASVVGASLLVVIALAGVTFAASGANNEGASVHVAGVPSVPTEKSKVDVPGTNKTRRHTMTTTSTTTNVGSLDRRAPSNRATAPTPTAPGATGTSGATMFGYPPGDTGTVTTTPTTSNPAQSTPATTTIPGSIDINDWCAPGPAGQVTLTVHVDAQPIAQGKWHVSGTLTIHNNSSYDIATMGYVYLSNTTMPGGSGEAWLGWEGTSDFAYGSGAVMSGFADAPAGQVTVLNLEQTVHTDGATNALTSNSTPPTAIHQGQQYGGVGHPLNKVCTNLPNITTNFPIGGSPPS